MVRIRAAVDARTAGTDIFILARTDARIIGLEEAITRCKEFRRLGADMTFLEAPLSIEEMRTYCSQVDGPKMANMLEHGKTPILPAKELREIGYVLAAYPLTLLSAAMRGMMEVLESLKSGDGAGVESKILPFTETCRLVGFEEYWEEEKRLVATSDLAICANNNVPFSDMIPHVIQSSTSQSPTNHGILQMHCLGFHSVYNFT